MNNFDLAQERYSRQMLLPEIRIEGQRQLSQKRVVVVVVGALGTVAAELLVRAGVHNLLLIDRDIIELSNLQRQVLFEEKDIGRSKAAVAQEKLQRIDSKAAIVIEAIYLHQKNIKILQRYDLVLDCTDNLKTRLLLNDFCHQEKITWIYAAVIKTTGYVMPIFPEGPCLGCFLTKPSTETCDTVGVLNTAAAIVAAHQATLALKILIGTEVPPLLLFTDVWKQESRNLIVRRNPDCKTCQGTYLHLDENNEKGTPRFMRFCSDGIYQLERPDLNFSELRSRWQKLGPVQEDAATIRFDQITVFKDGRILIRAASGQEAESLYARWIGA